MVSSQRATLPLSVSLLVLFFGYLCVDIISPAIPTIQTALGLSATGAGMVVSLFFAGRLVTNLPAAWMAEHLGPRWTAVCGAATLLVGSVLAALATSEMMLLPARVIQGGGVAILATAGLLSVLRARTDGAAAMTAFNVSSGVGGSVGLFAGGYLAGQAGWQSIFWLSAIVSVVLLLATLAARSKPGVTKASLPDTRPGDNAAPAVRGAEAVAVVANLLVFVNYSIWIVALPLLVAQRFGFAAGEVGLTLLFVNIVHLLSAVPVGRAIRLAGATRALVAGLGLTGLALLLIPVAPNIAWLSLPLILYAVGMVAGNSAAGDLILRLGGGGGRAVGAVRLSSDIGLVVGPAAAGMLADAAGVGAPFIVLGAVALLATGAGLWLNRWWPREWRPPEA